MLKTSGIIKLTLRENLRGQILWSSAIAGGVLLLLMSVLSGVTLSHQSRVIDVFSYFAADQLLLFVAILSGSQICSTDFSSRGLAELFIPAGTSRQSLYVARFIAFASMLLTLALALFLLKIFILPRLADEIDKTQYNIQLTMLLFAWLKSLTALSVAGFFGSLVRPLYAILASVTLFSIGHLTSSFDSLLHAAQPINNTPGVSEGNSFLYFIFKIWNPNLLIVDSAKGEWIQPSASNIIAGALWAAAFVFIPMGLAFIRLQKIDLRS